MKREYVPKGILVRAKATRNRHLQPIPQPQSDSSAWTLCDLGCDSKNCTRGFDTVRLTVRCDRTLIECVRHPSQWRRGNRIWTYYGDRVSKLEIRPMGAFVYITMQFSVSRCKYGSNQGFTGVEDVRIVASQMHATAESVIEHLPPLFNWNLTRIDAYVDFHLNRGKVDFSKALSLIRTRKGMNSESYDGGLHVTNTARGLRIYWKLPNTLRIEVSVKSSRISAAGLGSCLWDLRLDKCPLTDLVCREFAKWNCLDSEQPESSMRMLAEILLESKS